MSNINKFYNGNQILKNVDLVIDESDRIGLVGINGCGKTTLLRILTGKEEPDRFTEEDGVISFASKTNIGYLEQMGALDNENTVNFLISSSDFVFFCDLLFPHRFVCRIAAEEFQGRCHSGALKLCQSGKMLCMLN